MPRDPVGLARELREALLGFCPETYSGPDCVAAAEEYARTAKVCSAAAARAAAWASDRGAYRAKGFTDAAEWFARANGVTPSEAKAAMETAWAVEECPPPRTPSWPVTSPPARPRS
jgi:hypothetical protein